ncbi:hypothetical protein E0H47_24140 [Rhizobium leguminosarum bv. viciae]|uniref:hypothetical protein n=1 Tax=Rhizobium leguminosarum TaxID=384 RepID=UPI001039861E|nr:hypothetical protein [Rhizobium leguminosarum]TBZ35725.1 hypothetical protein E0H47_24140 [Rhizobium leguminosarum bv. viciae]
MTQTDPAQATLNSPVEDELWAAFARLKNKISQGRAVRISYSAVAAEAGRSRTLIGHDDCAYQAVRKAVGKAIDAQKRLKTPRVGPTSSAHPDDFSAPKKTAIDEPDPADPFLLIAHLEDRVADLTRRNKVAAIKIVTIDDENQQLREEIKRLKTELTRRRFVPTN